MPHPVVVLHRRSGILLGIASFTILLSAPVIARQTAATDVTTRPFAEVAVYPRREAPATVISQNESRLSAEIAAPIASLPVDVGQRVAKGAVVATLDAGDFKLMVASAEAALNAARVKAALARAQLVRARGLQEKGFISIDALAQKDTETRVAEADVKVQEAALATARRSLAKTKLVAPFPAVVKARSGQVGELASPGTPIITLIDTSQVQVAAQVQGRDVAALSKASDIRFETGRETLPLKLLRVSPAVSRESRAQEARLGFAGTAPAIGLEGRVVWSDTVAHVPADLLVRRDGRLGVFVAAGDKARFMALPGAEEGRAAPLAADANIRIITTGRAMLQDGQVISQQAAR